MELSSRGQQRPGKEESSNDDASTHHSPATHAGCNRPRVGRTSVTGALRSQHSPPHPPHGPGWQATPVRPTRGSDGAPRVERDRRPADPTFALTVRRLGWGVGVRWDSRILPPGFDSRPLHRQDMQAPGTGPGAASSGTREYRKSIAMSWENQAGTIVPKLLLTPREAARALSVSERTLWSITVPRGDLPCVRLAGRTVRYDVEALRRFLAERGERGNG